MTMSVFEIMFWGFFFYLYTGCIVLAIIGIKECVLWIFDTDKLELLKETERQNILLKSDHEKLFDTHYGKTSYRKLKNISDV